MFLVNSAWTSSSSALPSNAFQQIVGPEELPESLLDQRDKKARGGPTSSAGGVGARRSSNTSDYQGGGGGVDIYTYPFQQQTADNHNMREIPMEDLEIAMKVVIVGNGSVGKSSMIQRFCRGIFTRDYKKTIGVDFLERILAVDDQPVRLMLWDTAGQEEFDAITRTYYRGANACVLACSITDKDSFLALPKWKNKVCRECGDVPMVIVANKIDLQKESVVDSAELEGMARSLGITKLIKTSVKDDLNVSTVFSYLAQSYMNCILSQVSGMDSHDPYIDPMMMNEANSMHAPLYSHLHHSPTNNKSSQQQQQQHHNQQKGLISNGHSNNNKKGSSDNNHHQIALLNGNNKSNNKTGKSLFRNPIILKSSQPIIGTPQQSTPPTPSPPPNINNNNHNNSNNNSSGGGGGFAGFFSSSKTKQSNYNNHPQNNNYQQHAQHQNLFHRNNRSNKYPANMLPPPVALINGQMMHRPSPYAPFINGHGALAARDPRHWNDNIPFRLDLVKDRKRRKETSSCTIL